jgi:hypothetical protein
VKPNSRLLVLSLQPLACLILPGKNHFFKIFLRHVWVLVVVVDEVLIVDEERILSLVIAALLNLTNVYEPVFMRLVVVTVSLRLAQYQPRAATILAVSTFGSDLSLQKTPSTV